MTKKKLNIDSITNELEGASLFFTKPATPPPAKKHEVSETNKPTDLLADSPFFESPSNPPLVSESEKTIGDTKANTLPESTLPGKVQTTARIQKGVSSNKPEKQISKKSSNTNNKGQMDISMQASNNASMHEYMQSLAHDSIIEVIRKAVKYVGKDSATYRFTPEEKKSLLELSFSFKMQGFKTSENELVRIAINFLLEDQKLNGRNSVLQRVLDALNK